MRPRREFPTSVKRDAYERSQGICECWRIPHVFKAACGLPLGIGNIFYEHIICDGIDGEPTLDNCACLTRTCWKFKTDRYDKPVVAKARRVSDIARNIKARSYRPIAGTKASGIKKPLRPYADPIDRRTGLPWRGR